jgi:hypothetical protein
MKTLLALACVVALTHTMAAQQGVPPAAGRGAPPPAPGAPPPGQGRGGPAPQGRAGGPPPTPQAAAPIDLTGYWVAVISEDWRWRMVTPAKGDYASIPLTQAGKDLADQWDPARDQSAGEQCKSYGAPGLMRAPTRLRISWQDERTLKVDTDYGTQTRLLYFAPAAPPPGGPTLQGSSVAQWEAPARGRGAAVGPMGGNLKVVTTNLRPGYLRKNGVPYSAATTFTEYWDLFAASERAPLLVITSVVHDPQNLQFDWITSLNFRKEADGAKWDPSPCSTTW